MTKVTIKQAREIFANRGMELPEFKRNKHGNKPSEWTGLWRGKAVTLKFSSIKEMDRGLELIIMERTGIISDLEFQKRFLINEKLKAMPHQKSEQAMHYTADSYYKDNDIGRFVVEDVKSEDTRKKADYVMRRKLMKARYPYLVFRET